MPIAKKGRGKKRKDALGRRGDQSVSVARNRFRWFLLGAIVLWVTLSVIVLHEPGLGSLVAGLRPQTGAELREQIAQGEELYALHCASCHGVNLEGQPDWKVALPDGTYPAPPHDETGHTWHHDDELLFRVTKQGGESTARGWKTGMPAFGDLLDDQEIWAVLEFIKSRWPDEIRKRQARLNH